MIPRLRPAHAAPGAGAWILWASELSPFALKVDALCDYAGLPHRWLPAEGGFREGVAAARRVRRLRAGRIPLTAPPANELDELPQVPYLLGPRGENLFDSSAIGEWLDGPGRAHHPAASPCLPDEPALRFAVRLVDELFDELGLYLVHHNRWVVSARDNDAGARLAREFRPILGPLAPALGPRFAARQVRRLPYLFSVAPDELVADDLPERLRPPRRAGFPPTHALLEGCFARLLAVLEALLAGRPYLFGERFCLADASVYGQLAMNLSDPSAARWIRRDAPGVTAWLERIASADFERSGPGETLALDEPLRPLLAEACEVFVPLMQQNLDAWRRAWAAGERRFNEAGFDAGLALYSGVLRGQPYRAVAKTFQVRVWQSLRSEWDALAPAERARLAALLPGDHGLDSDRAGT